jgi:hypothetical protein
MKVFDRRRRWHFPRGVLEVCLSLEENPTFFPWCPGALGLEQK